ncbi:MAG: HEAT repeat domain-containing protein [Pirellulales bacterium]
MTTSAQNRDEPPGGHWQPPAGDDLLPPVQPPSAGFIIQLFVVPALIVLVIVAVWLSFNWLVRRTATRPQDLIQGLEQGPSIARWQRASELADMLRNKRFAEFKRSSEAAGHLARILDREIDHGSSAGGMEEGQVTLRYFLTRALGEFEVPEGIDVLLKAAETGRDPREQIVRHGALEAIAVRAFNLRGLEPPQALEHPDLEQTLVRLADDEEPNIRSQTAYTLGQIGTPKAIDRLALMADDADPDTRYNAAVALAHHGNDKGVATLAEMLDPEELATVQRTTNSPTAALNRGVIVQTAMEAAQELSRKNREADLSLVIAALERLAHADPKVLVDAQLPPRVASDARRALEAIARATAARAQQ